MSEGLPGERRFLSWAERQAHESWLGPRLHTLETAVPYGSAFLVYAPVAHWVFARPPCAPWPPA